MLTAHPRIIRAALPHLRKSKSPRIVNIASTEALGATALHSPYSAAKGGVASLTRSLAVELGREGITVNCICPGRSAPPSPTASPRSTRPSTPSAAPHSAATAIPRRSRT